MVPSPKTPKMPGVTTHDGDVPRDSLFWTYEKSETLQLAVDRIFGPDAGLIRDLGFSFTIADPRLDDCPLLGCSMGFCKLCGYDLDEIIGRNCRFLVDPVPPELVSAKVRRSARDFCLAVRDRREFVLSESDREPWMPPARHTDDGLFCVQTNARKNGSLYQSLFYLRMVELDDLPYVIALQTEVEGVGVGLGAPVEECHKAARILDSNMAQVERVLAGMFWVTMPMSRQEDLEQDDGYIA